MEDEERRWTDENIDMVALKHFPNIDKEKAMSRPILYSNWLSKVKRDISIEALTIADTKYPIKRVNLCPSLLLGSTRSSVLSTVHAMIGFTVDNKDC